MMEMFAWADAFVVVGFIFGMAALIHGFPSLVSVKDVYYNGDCGEEKK